MLFHFIIYFNKNILCIPVPECIFCNFFATPAHPYISKPAIKIMFLYITEKLEKNLKKEKKERSLQENNL